jgi:tRNA-specific 2-thiouridylase
VKVLVALSGGVDSSVAAAELIAAGHEVVGITMRLWGGESDTGCCSIADVDDARRVAQQLGIDHLVFNFTEDFDRHVVEPYVEAHRQGITPNPCIECNRHLKFDRLAERADLLGFDAVATGHHARIVYHDGLPWVGRGVDEAKDQSYVVHMLPGRELARTLFPIGHLTKAEVRARATALGLRTAAKPDSQDVCFITHEGGRERFLGDRIPFRRATVVDVATGEHVGEVDAVEMVTVGQRRGLGLPGGGPKQFVVAIDHEAAVVSVGDESLLSTVTTEVGATTWPYLAPAEGSVVEALVQCSAHGEAMPARVRVGVRGSAEVEWDEPHRIVSPGQTVVFYDLDGDRVLGGAVVQPPRRG